ncbi:MAG TPA: YbhN family protein [Acidimicrobiales bacterium]|nr:YbhN family protein [Acidimicrobiales bacterium]
MDNVTTPPDPPIVAPSAGRWYAIWRIARYVIGLAAVGIAAWVISGKTDELSGASTYLENLRWYWMLVAVFAEAVSYLAVASLQRRLLWCGRVKVPMVPMTGISLAGNAIQNSLPGGLAFFYVYNFRQYRRFGADDVLAGWTVVAVNAVSFVTLSAVAAVGVALALSSGNAYDLVEAILGIAIAASLVVITWAERARLLSHASWLVRLSQRLFHWPSPRLTPDQVVTAWMGRMGAIAPSRRNWARAVAMGLGNWVADCGCLALSFMAVGAGVPWRGLLLAYGAGQLASTMPFTPGGLGVVEGSLTVALVTFGGGEFSTVAAVLVYRLISYWLMLPVGWGAWGTLALAGRNRRQALQETSP